VRGTTFVIATFLNSKLILNKNSGKTIVVERGFEKVPNLA
jgi:hypothetical protein